MRNLERPIPVQFYVTADEKALIEKKMAALGTQNLSAYLRKMALDGYILRLDLPELKEMVTQMKRIGNNVNQIARKANADGRIYDVDVREVCDNQEKIWEGLRNIMDRMSKID